MKNTYFKLLSLILTLALMISSLGVVAFADETEGSIIDTDFLFGATEEESQEEEEPADTETDTETDIETEDETVTEDTELETEPETEEIGDVI